MRLWERIRGVNRHRPIISPSTGSGEAKDEISGVLECTGSSALSWRETAACRGTEEVDVKVSQAVGAIVWADASRVAAAAAGSGEVELWTLSVAV